MADKRDAARYRKRIRLRFGKTSPPGNLAYTEDISMTGIFIKTPNVLQPGNCISIILEVPDTDPVVMEGRIMWAKRVPLSLIHRVNKSGMGVKIVKILSGGSVFLQLNEELRHTKKSLP